MQSNNKVFSKALDKFVSLNNPWLSTLENWQWCIRENSTYLDCPIAEYDKSNINMIVAFFNPGSVQTNYVEMAIPHGKVKV